MKSAMPAILSLAVLIAGSSRAAAQEASASAPNVSLDLPRPTQSDVPAGPTTPAPCWSDFGSCWANSGSSSPCGPPGRFWADAEVLLWWMSGARLPPLLATSPPGTPRAEAGVIGAPGTTVVFGGNPVNQDLRVGTRITVGMWLDCQQTIGLEAYYFQLNTQATGVTAGSPGIVGRPFFDTASGLPNAELVSFPGILNGEAPASASSTGLLGAGLLARCNLCCGCNYRLDLLTGYRFLYLSDRVSVDENLLSTDVTEVSAPFGTRIFITDQFATQNTFHGLDVGLAGTRWWDKWMLQSQARIAFGDSHEVANIFGSTTVAIPDLPPETRPGGLLALSSNMGQHTRDTFAVVPELDLRLGYRVTPNLCVYAGYTFLFWSQVLRAGDQIDTVVNPGLLPPAIPGTTPLRPAFNFNGTSICAQGINLGLSLRY